MLSFKEKPEIQNILLQKVNNLILKSNFFVCFVFFVCDVLFCFCFFQMDALALFFRSCPAAVLWLSHPPV